MSFINPRFKFNKKHVFVIDSSDFGRLFLNLMDFGLVSATRGRRGVCGEARTDGRTDCFRVFFDMFVVGAGRSPPHKNKGLWAPKN